MCDIGFDLQPLPQLLLELLEQIVFLKLQVEVEQIRMGWVCLFELVEEHEHVETCSYDLLIELDQVPVLTKLVLLAHCQPHETVLLPVLTFLVRVIDPQLLIVTANLIQENVYYLLLKVAETDLRYHFSHNVQFKVIVHRFRHSQQQFRSQEEHLKLSLLFRSVSCVEAHILRKVKVDSLG